MTTEYMIDANQAHLLSISDKIIDDICEEITFRSGNNTKHLCGDGVKCEAYRRTTLVQQTDTFFDPTKKRDLENVSHHPMRRAALVKAFKAGYCQDLAALAYCIAKDILSVQYKIAIVVDTIARHAFCVIFPTPNNNSIPKTEHIITVDPWPLRPKATLWIHHFAYRPSILEHILHAYMLDNEDDIPMDYFYNCSIIKMSTGIGTTENNHPDNRKRKREAQTPRMSIVEERAEYISKNSEFNMAALQPIQCDTQFNRQSPTSTNHRDIEYYLPPRVPLAKLQGVRFRPS